MPSFRLVALIGVAVIAVFLRPILFSIKKAVLLAPPDETIGQIDFVKKAEQLAPYIKGKRVLVVGGTRGIGYGAALAAAAAGADRVTVVGRSPQTGFRAVDRIRLALGGSYANNVEYVRGDIGTVCSAKDLVRVLVNETQGSDDDRRYDYLVVTAAVFPDWSQKLQNEDGLDRGFGVGVVGRYIVYRNMHRFMSGSESDRVLNVMGSGNKLPLGKGLDRDVVVGKKDVPSLIEGVKTFAIGNEIMLVALHEEDENVAGKVTMVSTHPGIIVTDLLKNQNAFVKALSPLMASIVGISEEESGLRQSSILVSDKLREKSLSYVDDFGHGRLLYPALEEQIKLHKEWVWKLLADLEAKEC